jgi:Protein kinase domain
MHFKGKSGYTKAVDMWSLGCVTVVLLTGGSPFVSQKTNQYSQKLAQECNLQQLDHVAEWQFVGKRPKDFVRRLLVLNEEHRMSAKDARLHWWFSNDFHRLDFEEVYQRATKHWRPRTLKSPVIEMVDTVRLKELPVMQKRDLLVRHNSRKRSPVPIDPPYKPYPRRMSLSLLPKRTPTMSGILADEVRTAIQENWSPLKTRAQASDTEAEGVPALIPDTEANELDRLRDRQDLKDAQGKIAVSHRPRPSFMSPFRPLVQKESTPVQEETSKANTDCKNLSVEGSLTPIAGRASRCSIASDEPNPVKESGSGGQLGEAQAAVRDIGESGPRLPAVKTAHNHDITHPTVGDAVTTHGKSAFNQDTGHVAAEESSEQIVYRAKDTASEITPQQDLGVIDCRESTPEVSMSEAAVHTRPLVQADMQTFQRMNTQSKLRLPLKTRSAATLRQPSNMKRRRGSIYDIEGDEESEQAQRGLRRLTLASNSTTSRQIMVWKKARTELDEQIH